MRLVDFVKTIKEGDKPVFGYFNKKTGLIFLTNSKIYTYREH